ncbi:uncharacterized protein [Penaeus vannamei]|uniref:uncharacterized protein n=1 Tax=Penaeus vannamei TaxID=6689 RepID=UPI00387FB036
MDRKTHKLMTNRTLHRRANVARQYLQRNEGGRGLQSAEETIRTEEHGLSDYIKNDEKGYNRLLKRLTKTRSKSEYQNRQKETKEKDWKEKALHGQYAKIADKTDIKRNCKWIKNGYMKKETEGLITAAQDQALPTRWRKVKIEKQSGTSLCRVYNERDETTFHILSKCSKIAQTEYKRRHDKLAQLVHWNLCKRCRLQHERNWYDHTAEKGLENENVKIFQPDIIVKDKGNEPYLDNRHSNARGCKNRRKGEEYRKISEHCRDISRLWMTSTNVVAVIVGALGTVVRLEEF